MIMNDHIAQAEQLKEELYQKVFSFMTDNRIHCEETIHQCDWVIENAYGFIEDLFNVIKPNLPSVNYED